MQDFFSRVFPSRADKRLWVQRLRLPPYELHKAALEKQCSDIVCNCVCFLLVKIPSWWLRLELALLRGSVTTKPSKNSDVQ